MRIDGFEWDEHNVIKNILAHDSYPDEIEENFYNPHKLRKTKDRKYLLYGITDTGRYVFTVFKIKKRAQRNIARVISARNMTKREKNYYLKKK